MALTHSFAQSKKLPPYMDNTNIKEFKRLYNEFRTVRNAAFALANDCKIEAYEVFPRFSLRLAQWYEAAHDRTNDDVDKAFQAARDAGAALLDLIFLEWTNSPWAKEGTPERTYLTKNGFAELGNVSMFTQPLQAMNRKRQEAESRTIN